jgi:hypothetical protein
MLSEYPLSRVFSKSYVKNASTLPLVVVVNFMVTLLSNLPATASGKSSGWRCHSIL